MSFSLLKSWDNRKTAPRPATAHGKSWTRRIQWLTGESFSKLKLEDGDQYKEVLTDDVSAQRVWDRFKAGQSIDDAVSILGNPVPPALQSRKAARKEAK